MYYNYPILKLNYRHLQKYDILDEKLINYTHLRPYCIGSLQVESPIVQKQILLSALLTQEWFYGQKLMIKGSITLNSYNKSTISFKTTVRELNFWSLLDLCLDSIFISDNLKNKLPVDYCCTNNSYLLAFFLDQVKTQILPREIKEDNFSPFFKKNKLIASINFSLNKRISLHNYFIPL